jgi:tetratricopeptide (TPR) repeat protein
MTLRESKGHRLLLELRARDAWNQRDYVGAQNLAQEVATAAKADGDELGWWNAQFLVSECLRKQGLMKESRSTAEILSKHPLTAGSKALSARVSTIVSLALQGAGELSLAVAAARRAVQDALQSVDDANVEIEARNALIASLADSDQLDIAWQECLALVEFLESQPPSKYVGQSYWAIGNVAFLLQRVSDGVAYHQLAARTLSPTNDLDLWAHFNRASASLRLTAGVIEPETLECIERAELASSIVGGTDRDRLELKLTRAQWLVLTGQFEVAVEHLADIIEHKDLLATHVAAQAHFLMGQALSARGDDVDAIHHLASSEELFLQSGAEERSLTARALIHSIEQPQG